MDLETGRSNRSEDEPDLFTGGLIPVFREIFKVLQISVLVSVGVSLVLFISLVFLNFFIYKTLKKKERLLPPIPARVKREHFIATNLIVIVMFAICHSLKSFINIIEMCQVVSGKQLWGEKMNILVAISHLCITFKSSINFVIYCVKDEKFRRHFVRWLTFGHFSLSSDEDYVNL